MCFKQYWMNTGIETRGRVDPGENSRISWKRVVWGTRDLNSQTSLGASKTNIPQIRNVVWDTQLTEPYHSSRHVAPIQNLTRDPFQALDWSWRSALPWAGRRCWSSPSMNFTGSVQTGSADPWSAVSPDRHCSAPLACLLGFLRRAQSVRSGWQAARSQEHVWAICGVRPVKEGVGVCVCVCVEAGAAVCLQEWGGASLPALCNHVLIIPSHRQWSVFSCMHDERFQSGVVCCQSGPETCVHLFLSYLHLERNFIWFPCTTQKCSKGGFLSEAPICLFS